MVLAVNVPEDCAEDEFRAAARRCLVRNVPPEEVLFASGATGSLFEELGLDEGQGTGGEIKVPRGFDTLVSKVVCHSAPDRFALLYRLLWRIRSGDRDILGKLADPDVMRAARYAKAVDKDIYRMHAYVRFRERKIDGSAVFVAWHEPQHRILRHAVPFFIDRFSNMDWLIATPIGTAAWRNDTLTFGPPATRPSLAEDRVLDEIWTKYFRATFNPARLRVKAMVAQMPKRYWPTMPETASIPGLIQEAGNRVEMMEERTPEAPPAFATKIAERMAETSSSMLQLESLEALHQEVGRCRKCSLHGPATQAVLGKGPQDADIMFVGEQPGDQEDLAGLPFVGPAGGVFDRALAEVGIVRSKAYVTNAVKHFKFEPRGKRRVHSKPNGGEVTQCRFWLDRELALVKPKLVVALGATAVLALTGRTMAVTKERGRILPFAGRSMLITVHPSYILRLPDPDTAEAEYRRFVEDLTAARAWCKAA